MFFSLFFLLFLSHVLVYNPTWRNQKFGLNHYAEPVTYDVEGFLDKNKDSLTADVVGVLAACKLNLILEIFIEGRV
jgi:myosin heavy subunit